MIAPLALATSFFDRSQTNSNSTETSLVVNLDMRGLGTVPETL